MLRPDPETLARIVKDRILCLVEYGNFDGITPDPDSGYTCESVFGFTLAEIEGVHTYKTGVGGGMWFRLKDGRVIAGPGEEDDPDPALYDTVDN